MPSSVQRAETTITSRRAEYGVTSTVVQIPASGDRTSGKTIHDIFAAVGGIEPAVLEEVTTYTVQD